MSNQNTEPRSFVHRRNRDGSFDSICSLCAVTAASSTVEKDLAEGEKTHKCDPYVLETRRKLMSQPQRGRAKPPSTES